MKELKIIARILLSGLLVAAGLLVTLLLYILLADKPYGIQIATLIAYSMAIFFLVFMRSRLAHGFKLTSEPVVFGSSIICVPSVRFGYCVRAVYSHTPTEDG